MRFKIGSREHDERSLVQQPLKWPQSMRKEERSIVYGQLTASVPKSSLLGSVVDVVLQRPTNTLCMIFIILVSLENEIKKYSHWVA